jgi:hypothetical protein
VQEKLVDLALSELLPYVIAAACLCVLAVAEGVATLGHWGRHPQAYALAALVAAGACTWKIWRSRDRIEALRLGRDGERTVGEYLEHLRTQGASVFHDIQAGGFNLDHVVLSPRGFYAIETKAWTKPPDADARITLADGSLLAAGCSPDRDPIKQAQAGAGWLSRLLEESTGRRFHVRGVILFPGWWVEPMSRSWRQLADNPWVLSPRALPSFIKNSAVQIAEEDVKLASYHLSRFVRTQAVK